MTRIMIVDDEIETLNMMSIFLEISGYEPCTTLNSASAVSLAESKHPDCILLDIMMPGLDGFSLCKLLRNHPQTANLPILFVTAYCSLDLEDRRIQAGADQVIMKPFGMDNLIETIDRVIANKIESTWQMVLN